MRYHRGAVGPFLIVNTVLSSIRNLKLNYSHSPALERRQAVALSAATLHAKSCNLEIKWKMECFHTKFI